MITVRGLVSATNVCSSGGLRSPLAFLHKVRASFSSLVTSFGSVFGGGKYGVVEDLG